MGEHPEKLAQRDPASMKDLMEVCCLLVAIHEPIRLHIGDGAGFEQLDDMFMEGTLGVIRNPFALHKNGTGNQNSVQMRRYSQEQIIQ